MHEALTLALACGAGGGLGALFFGGLWWTVRNRVSSDQPALWFVGSLLVRLCMAMAGFYFVSGRHGDRMMLCLVGFITASLAVTWLTSAAREDRARREPEAIDAP